MEQTLTSFAVVVVLVMITIVVFGGWVLGRVARGIGLMLGLIPPKPAMLPPQLRRPATAPFRPSYTPSAANGFVMCGVPGCRHANPAGAKFCRHCGHGLAMHGQQPLPVIWGPR